MSRFTETPLKLTPLSEWHRIHNVPITRSVERSWVVQEPITYEIGEVGSGMTVHVPAGFVTDLASIPRIFWVWTPPFGRHALAAVVHDFLYTTHSINTPTGRKHCSRALADDVFMEAMTVLEVRSSRASTLYAGVRVGGALSYHRAYENRLSRFKRRT